MVEWVALGHRLALGAVDLAWRVQDWVAAKGQWMGVVAAARWAEAVLAQSAALARWMLAVVVGSVVVATAARQALPRREEGS